MNRRAISLLLFGVAMVACMWGIRTAKADVEIHALAVCKDGKCVMTEKDYKDLQEFTRMARQILTDSAEMDEKRDNNLREYQGALAVCRERLEQKHVSTRE